MPKKSAEHASKKMNKRRTPDADQTRKNILDAALEIILKKGFAETSVDEIARRASVAKGTIFFHFKSKLGLLLEVFLSLSKLEESYPGLENKYKEGWTEEDVLKYAADKTFEHAEKKAALRRLWMLEALRLKGKKGLFYKELVQRPVTPIENFIKHRQEEGIFRELDPYVVAMAFFGSLFAIRLWHQHMQGDVIHPISYKELGEQITDLFLNGLMTKGAKGRSVSNKKNIHHQDVKLRDKGGDHEIR